MKPAIKPGMLCYLKSDYTVRPFAHGKVVTTVRVSSCECEHCEHLRSVDDRVWIVSAPWILEEVGANEGSASESILVPITPPGLTDETVTDINAPTLVGVV
jgi:hypothetical protein